MTARMDFRGRIVGEFVYHCRITNHSYSGVMADHPVLRNKLDLLAAAGKTDTAVEAMNEFYGTRLIAARDSCFALTHSAAGSNVSSPETTARASA